MPPVVKYCLVTRILLTQWQTTKRVGPREKKNEAKNVNYKL
jgi:hypothetical protein